MDDDDFRNMIVKNFGIAISIAKNVDSLSVFGKYVNELVAEGRSGNDKSFLDAVRIDPTVVASEAFSARLSRAVLLDEKIFLDKLQASLKGKTAKHKSQLNRVRVAARFLIDAKADHLSDDDLETLFVERLKLYSPGEDGAKALRSHIGKQKPSTRQKRQK